MLKSFPWEKINREIMTSYDNNDNDDNNNSDNENEGLPLETGSQGISVLCLSDHFVLDIFAPECRKMHL